MDNEIAISGTGIAGLAGHGRYRSRPRLCSSDHTGDEGGVQHSNGWAALEVLGLAQDVLSRATRLHEITVHSLTIMQLWQGCHSRMSTPVARADLATVFEQKIGQTAGFASQHDCRAGEPNEDGVAIISKVAGLHHVAGLVAADGVAGLVVPLFLDRDSHRRRLQTR